VFTTLHDFESPNGSGPSAALVVGDDSRLYGTTASGGTNSSGATTTAGTIFSIARDGTGFTKIYSFDGAAGAAPNSALLQLDDTVFIGTTGSGGRCSEGTVFRLSLTGDTIDGLTSCGSGSRDSGGGGVTSPFAILWLLGAGLAGARRRRWPSDAC
jgi:MYXO-CTERM domain-containing protein